MKLPVALLALILLGACSGEDDDSAPAPPVELSPVEPLPECPDFDYSPCDILDADCQSQRFELAACLRQSDVPDGVSIELMTPEQYADVIRADLAEEPEPTVSHLREALEILELIRGEPSTLDERIAAHVAELAGVYRSDEDRIVVIDQGDPNDGIGPNATLLHEMIHALQDQEHDLTTWPADVDVESFDASLASSSVVEGEAKFYQLRALAPMLGVDINDADFEQLLHEHYDFQMEPVFSSSSPFGASFLSFPYAFGAWQAYHAWLDGGSSAVSEYFTSVPLTTQSVMARFYELDEPQEAGIEITEPTTSVLTLDSDDSLGAWGLLLLLIPRGIDAETQAHALSWRGDQLWVYTDASAVGTWALWQIELSSAEEAQYFDSALSGRFLVRHATQGTRVYAVLGSTSLGSTELEEWGKTWIAESE